MLFAETCITPEPVPKASDSIIRIMPDEVRTAVYWFVRPPVKATVSVPKLLLLEIGLYETEEMGYGVVTPAACTSSMPAVIVPVEARTKLPAAATGLLLLSWPENWNEYVAAGRREGTTVTLV